VIRNSKLIAALALSAACTSVHALNDQPAAAHSAPTSFATAPGAHFILNGGLTYGGDTLVTVNYSDGSSGKVKAGSFVQLGAGMLYQMQDKPVALQITANYHYDLEQGSNGSVLFYRYPIEALAYYTGNERWRLGGGVRYVLNPMRTVTMSGKYRISFDNAFGLVGETGYAITPNFWVNVRAVLEKYQPNDYTINDVLAADMSASPSVNGNHIGVNFSYQF